MPSSTLSPPPAHRLESTPLRVRVVPPSPTHGRLDRPLVDRLLHVHSKRFEVREKRHRELLCIRRRGERVHHLFQDPKQPRANTAYVRSSGSTPASVIIESWSCSARGICRFWKHAKRRHV